MSNKSSYIRNLETALAASLASQNRLEKELTASCGLLKHKSDNILQLEGRLLDQQREFRSNADVIVKLNSQSLSLLECLDRRPLLKPRGRHNLKASIKVLKQHLQRTPNSALCQKFISHVLRQRHQASVHNEIVLTWRGAAKGIRKVTKRFISVPEQNSPPKSSSFAGRNGIVTRLVCWIHT